MVVLIITFTENIKLELIQCLVLHKNTATKATITGTGIQIDLHMVEEKVNADQKEAKMPKIWLIEEEIGVVFQPEWYYCCNKICRVFF